MRYLRSSIDIINSIVSAMTFPVEIKTVTLNMNLTQTLLVCDMYHAQPGFKVTINLIEYTITDIDFPNNTITVTAGVAITPQTFELYHPYFYYGTPIEVGTRTIKKQMASERTPMIWLCVDGSFTEKIYEDESDSRERDINFDLYFLSQAKTDVWFSNDSFKYAIEPMNRLQEQFNKTLKRNPGLFNLIDKTYGRQFYQKFGVWIRNSGTQSNLWADKLAGNCVSFQPLTIFKDYYCNNICSCN